MPEGSKHIGTRLAEHEEAAESADVAIIGLVRDGKRRYGAARNAQLQAGDILVLKATPGALDEFRSALSLAFSDEEREEKLKARARARPHRGRGPAGRPHRRQDGAGGRPALAPATGLMGISRQGRRITEPVRNTEIRPGDILLLLVPKDTGDDVTTWLGCLPLADRGLP